MLPAERREVSEQLVWDILGLAQGGHGALQGVLVISMQRVTLSKSLI